MPTHKNEDFVISGWSTLKELEFPPASSYLEHKIREIFIGCVLF